MVEIVTRPDIWLLLIPLFLQQIKSVSLSQRFMTLMKRN